MKTKKQANRNTDWPAETFGLGGWIWTNDLRVMSPASYQTAPPRTIWLRPKRNNLFYIADNLMQWKYDLFTKLPQLSRLKAPKTDYQIFIPPF